MNGRRESDLLFTGSIPELYERYLVPLIFRPYADDLATRLVEIRPTAVLEVAAGTGVVTRTLASRLPEAVAITATDLNQPMLDHGATIGTSRPVSWRQADAMDLPFNDGSFDAVICQLGSPPPHASTRSRLAAGRRRARSRRSGFARAPRCATRSRPAIPAGWQKRPPSLPPRLVIGSGKPTSTARSEPT